MATATYVERGFLKYHPAHLHERQLLFVMLREVALQVNVHDFDTECVAYMSAKECRMIIGIADCHNLGNGSHDANRKGTETKNKLLNMYIYIYIYQFRQGTQIGIPSI